MGNCLFKHYEEDEQTMIKNKSIIIKKTSLSLQVRKYICGQKSKYSIGSEDISEDVSESEDDIELKDEVESDSKLESRRVYYSISGKVNDVLDDFIKEMGDIENPVL